MNFWKKCNKYYINENKKLYEIRKINSLFDEHRYINIWYYLKMKPEILLNYFIKIFYIYVLGCYNFKSKE